MTLHPILMAIFFLLFALLCVPPLLKYLQTKRYGLSILMIVAVAVFVSSAWYAGHVPVPK